MSGMQYTIRGISAELDARLREDARTKGVSLNAAVIETLEQAALPRDARHDDLDWFIGAAATHAPDPDADAAQAWLDGLPSDLA